MSRRGEAELRVKGMGLKRRFVLAMTIALSVVMVVAALLLYGGVSRVLDRAQRDTAAASVDLTQRQPRIEAESNAALLPSGVEVSRVTYGPEKSAGTLYRAPAPAAGQKGLELLVPDAAESGARALLGLIAVISVLVVAAGAFVAAWVASKVTRPIEAILADVRAISHGDLSKRVRAGGGGEIELLARSIERMTRDLQAAQDTELELQLRERELGLAADVREALVPVATPLLSGYDVASIHLTSARIGGDFHDYVEHADGRVGLLVCDVSGQGLPGAMIGAIARSYLRTELLHVGADAPHGVLEALKRVNRFLGADVRRGVYVTALYALVDPARGVATVASAGHKVPLLRSVAAEGALRAIHPEGIALGLDRGAVFDRRLQVVETAIEPGDRLFLCNSAPLRLTNAEGRELGEKALFARVQRHAGLESLDFLKALRNDLVAFTGADGPAEDVSLVTIARAR